MAGWGALGLGLFTLAIVVVADRGRFPPAIRRIYEFPGGDKIGHFLLTGLLAFLVCLAIPLQPARRPWSRLVIAAAILTVVFGLEEWSQSLFAARQASWADFAGSGVGIWLACWMAWRLRRTVPVGP